MSLQEFIPTPTFEDYRESFRDFFDLQRDDGVVAAAAHTVGGPIQLSVQNHRALGQILKTLGADPENEVLILTGSGEEFMMDSDPEGFELEEQDLPNWAYEYAYKDGRINISSLINDLEIPTIGIFNGPGFHSEIVLMCDITLCAEDATIFDLHYDIGSVPGDGIHSCFQELLGVKRAAYALLTGEAITARKGLEWGMVNEVLPRAASGPSGGDRRAHHEPASCHSPAHDSDRPASVEEAHRRRPGRRLRHPDVWPRRQAEVDPQPGHDLRDGEVRP
ncbi:enoyl-CoA hydratase/isomerase family protein [Parafrankia sp. BMG5.11]|uniref:enoyl-CoA hydratase/isomerase family protein n=1 Tax=Parafrankia sp. BMG5.11 TaxID=222540 RepID=UPI001A9E7590|nr:enoyl-CoA hydratase/isomerase family protein [Parafrankia sp. BMG5.11]